MKISVYLDIDLDSGELAQVANKINQTNWLKCHNAIKKTGILELEVLNSKDSYEDNENKVENLLNQNFSGLVHIQFCEEG